MYPTVDLHKKKSDALIIHCADPRFQNAYRAVIDGLDVYFDLIVAPGASKAVVDDPNVLSNIQLLESLHHFETIHILDHIECGAFGPIDNEMSSHTAMLAAAAKKIADAMPSQKVVAHLLGDTSELKVEL